MEVGLIEKRVAYRDLSLSVRNRGFALISTLMLLALIVLVVVGMLGMARQETRAAVQVKLRAQAQANARLGLELALARLQEDLGPDKRVAAPASIDDAGPDTLEAEGVAAPWLCGVWDSWRWRIPKRGVPAQGYGDEKVSRFRGWLISDPDAELVKDREFPKTLTFCGETIELVGAGSLRKDVSDDDARRVRAGLVDVTPDDPNAREWGRLAWVPACAPGGCVVAPDEVRPALPQACHDLIGAVEAVDGPDPPPAPQRGPRELPLEPAVDLPVHGSEHPLRQGPAGAPRSCRSRSRGPAAPLSRIHCCTRATACAQEPSPEITWPRKAQKVTSCG